MTYTGIYHSLLGKTIAYLKFNDSLTGETLTNLTIGDEVAPDFLILAIDNEAVTLKTTAEGETVRIPWQGSVTLTIPSKETPTE